jgi:hypothetical protein
MPSYASAGLCVEQRRPDLRGRAVDEPLAAKLTEHRGSLGRCQRPSWGRPRPSAAVDRRRRGAQRPARRAGADDRRDLFDGLLDHRSVLSRLVASSVASIYSKSAETFPWISITRQALFSSARAADALRSG